VTLLLHVPGIGRCAHDALPVALFLLDRNPEGELAYRVAFKDVFKLFCFASPYIVHGAHKCDDFEADGTHILLFRGL